MMLARTTRLKPEMRLSTHTSKQLAVSPSANQRASGHTLLMSSVCQMLMESTTRSGVPGSRSARSSCRRDTSTTPYPHGGASPPLHNRSAHTLSVQCCSGGQCARWGEEGAVHRGSVTARSGRRRWVAAGRWCMWCAPSCDRVKWRLRVMPTSRCPPGESESLMATNCATVSGESRSGLGFFLKCAILVASSAFSSAARRFLAALALTEGDLKQSSSSFGAG